MVSEAKDSFAIMLINAFCNKCLADLLLRFKTELSNRLKTVKGNLFFYFKRLNVWSFQCYDLSSLSSSKQ